MYILETERLLLRPLTPTDSDDIYEIFSDPQVMRYYPAPYTRAQVDALLQRILQSYAEHGFGLWAIVRKDAPDVIVGDCGLLLQPVEGQTELEIAYHLKPHFWGCGFATEAARACRDYALATLHAPRVVSLVGPDNQPSRRVAERVHTHMRMITWEKIGRVMCLYSTTQPQPAA
jgi:RimJ/RimL family protein N-acetyltransferase